MKIKKSFIYYYLLQIKALFVKTEYETNIKRSFIVAIIKLSFILVLINPVATYIMYLYDSGGLKPDREWNK